jgi:hypothetical protein
MVYLESSSSPVNIGLFGFLITKKKLLGHIFLRHPEFRYGIFTKLLFVDFKKWISSHYLKNPFEEVNGERGAEELRAHAIRRPGHGEGGKRDDERRRDEADQHPGAARQEHAATSAALLCGPRPAPPAATTGQNLEYATCSPRSSARPRLASETTVTNDTAASNADGGCRNGGDGRIISPPPR